MRKRRDVYSFITRLDRDDAQQAMLIDYLVTLAEHSKANTWVTEALLAAMPSAERAVPITQTVDSYQIASTQQPIKPMLPVQSYHDDSTSAWNDEPQYVQIDGEA